MASKLRARCTPSSNEQDSFSMGEAQRIDGEFNFPTLLLPSPELQIFLFHQTKGLVTRPDVYDNPSGCLFRNDQLPSSSPSATSPPLESLLPRNARPTYPNRARISLGGTRIRFLRRGVRRTTKRGGVEGRVASSESKPDPSFRLVPRLFLSFLQLI